MEFQWGPGEVSDLTAVKSIQDDYKEVVHWRRNSFLVPSGKIGKEGLVRLHQAYADNILLLLQHVSFYRCYCIA